MLQASNVEIASATRLAEGKSRPRIYARVRDAPTQAVNMPRVYIC